MSLRLRLIAAMALVLLATLAVGSLLIYRHMLSKVDVEMQAAIAVGQRIAQNALDDDDEAMSRPRRRLELLVADFNGDRHLKATLVDAGGTTLAQSKLAYPDELAPPWLHDLLQRPSLRAEVALPARFKDYGTLYLEADPANEIGEAWRDFKLYFALLFMFSGLVIVLSYFTVGRVLQPLADLTKAFHRIGAGDYAARVEAPKGPPEFAALCSGFNDMGEQLLEMRTRNDELRVQLDTVQEEERAGLARDLHDEVSPLLFSVDVDATMIREAEGGAASRLVAERADAIRAAVAQMKRHVKSILSQLRPSMISEFGLESAIETLKASWQARHPKVSFELLVAPRAFGPPTDEALYYLIRESVSNALRHANPSLISIEIMETEAGGARLRIIDNGGGLPVGGARAGFGITGMRERTEHLGGRLTVAGSPDGGGVVVEADIPRAAAGGTAPRTVSGVRAA